MIDEVNVTRAIIESYFEKLKDHLSVDVAVCGGGPSGLVAGSHLARKGMKVAVFDKRLSLGGGMWGGGMLFNTVVVQPAAEGILKDFKIRYQRRDDLLLAASVEAVSRLIIGAVEAGCEIFNAVSVQDVMEKKGKVCGLVINWGPVDSLISQGSPIEVDPLVIKADFSIDATGHGHYLCRVAREKGLKLRTKSGKPEGEGPLWSEEAEKMVVENSREVYPGLFVCGMAANAVFGAPRMGPIFGGMLLSGKKVAERILAQGKRP